ncbi:hypothetical protein CP97_14160 [Aurantiacibacter atlanticus]|uniref:Uncharacterized protein n=1 Tax=Aurantiacibacter atlanticus TaxID=1648404 RepID=A0A0H4VJ74_9SPHN|nr:hypothetical protein CP97_14160 [Aurantiacibacter atlanticus]
MQPQAVDEQVPRLTPYRRRNLTAQIAGRLDSIFNEVVVSNI